MYSAYRYQAVGQKSMVSAFYVKEGYFYHISQELIATIMYSKSINSLNNIFRQVCLKKPIKIGKNAPSKFFQ